MRKNNYLISKMFMAIFLLFSILNYVTKSFYYGMSVGYFFITLLFAACFIIFVGKKDGMPLIIVTSLYLLLIILSRGFISIHFFDLNSFNITLFVALLVVFILSLLDIEKINMVGIILSIISISLKLIGALFYFNGFHLNNTIFRFNFVFNSFNTILFEVALLSYFLSSVNSTLAPSNDIENSISKKEYQDNNNQTSPNSVSPLKKLSVLKDKGLITEQEYNEKKKELLQ